MLVPLFNKIAGLKACNFIKIKLQQVFSCKICKIFKNTYFEEHLLVIVQGFKIRFLVEPRQQKVLQTTILNRKEANLVSMKLEEMLEKGAFLKVRPSENQFLSNLFLVKKKDMGNGPVLNLKELNKFIS